MPRCRATTTAIVVGPGPASRVFAGSILVPLIQIVTLWKFVRRACASGLAKWRRIARVIWPAIVRPLFAKARWFVIWVIVKVSAIRVSSQAMAAMMR